MCLRHVAYWGNKGRKEESTQKFSEPHYVQKQSNIHIPKHETNYITVVTLGLRKKLSQWSSCLAIMRVWAWSPEWMSKMADLVGVLVIPALEARTAASRSLWPDNLTNLMSSRLMRDLSQRTWTVFLRIITKVVYWSPHACLHKCTYNCTHMNMHGNTQKKIPWLLVRRWVRRGRNKVQRQSGQTEWQTEWERNKKNRDQW